MVRGWGQGEEGRGFVHGLGSLQAPPAHIPLFLPCPPAHRPPFLTSLPFPAPHIHPPSGGGLCVRHVRAQGLHSLQPPPAYIPSSSAPHLPINPSHLSLIPPPPCSVGGCLCVWHVRAEGLLSLQAPPAYIPSSSRPHLPINPSCLSFPLISPSPSLLCRWWPVCLSLRTSQPSSTTCARFLTPPLSIFHPPPPASPDFPVLPPLAPPHLSTCRWLPACLACLSSRTSQPSSTTCSCSLAPPLPTPRPLLCRWLHVCRACSS